jgi:predicted nucleic acid-binding protein
MKQGFVVDNSVVMSWCFKDQDAAYVDSVLERLTEAVAFVPSVWPLEVVNVLVSAERRKIIGQADSTRFLSLLSQLPISVEYESPERVMKDLLGLARALKLSSYEAAYLALAMNKGLPLATSDVRLRSAARSANVSILKG